MFDRADDALMQYGRRFLRWRADLPRAQRWAIDLPILALFAVMAWLEIRDVLHFVGLL